LATSGGAYPHRDRTIAVLRLLLDAGADPNARNQAGEPPLMKACGYPPEILKLLIAKGADVNAVTEWNGKTRHVLDCLAEHHNLEGFALLARAGATKVK
jgi:ankyrin repeat protein